MCKSSTNKLTPVKVFKYHFKNGKEIHYLPQVEEKKVKNKNKINVENIKNMV